MVAHSIGGLSALYAMRKSGVAQHVKNFVSLGGPHRGSDVAAFVNSTAGSALKGSAVVTNLPDDLDEGDPTPGKTQYWSWDSGPHQWSSSVQGEGASIRIEDGDFSRVDPGDGDAETQADAQKILDWMNSNP